MDSNSRLGASLVYFIITNGGDRLAAEKLYHITNGFVKRKIQKSCTKNKSRFCAKINKKNFKKSIDRLKSVCYNVITIKERKPVRLRYKRMMNYTLTIKTTRGQREMGFADAATAYATFDFYAGDKKAFGIREVILIDEDALKMVTA